MHNYSTLITEDIPDDLVEIPDDPRYLFSKKNQQVYSARLKYGLYPMKKYPSYFSEDTMEVVNEPNFIIGFPNNKMVTISYLNTLEKKENIMSGFKFTGKHIVGSITKSGGRWSVAPLPQAHETGLQASAEAARLAKIHTEKKFVVLEVKGIVAFNDVVWE